MAVPECLIGPSRVATSSVHRSAYVDWPQAKVLINATTITTATTPVSTSSGSDSGQGMVSDSQTSQASTST